MLYYKQCQKENKEENKMTKANLKVGMLVVTADGKARLVMPTKVDGLVLMAEDNKALKLSKYAEDLKSSNYRHDKDIIQVFDIMDDINGHLFDEQNRDVLFDAEDDYDGFDDEDECDDCDCDCDDCDDCDCDKDCEECLSDAPTETLTSTDSTEAKGFTKSDVTPGMLAVTRDGKNRLAIPTSDMGLVLATEDSKFVRLDKLNDDLTIADYRKEGKNVDKVYGLAAGVTTNFYSEDNRPLLFER